MTFPLPEAGILQGLCWADGPTGGYTPLELVAFMSTHAFRLALIQSRYSTQFPAEIATAATFDRDLFYRRAYAMGAEYARLGAHVPLSLAVGPMGRSVYGGRNWEGFSADSFLAGEAIRYSVQAFQENKVTALVKHFVGSKPSSRSSQCIIDMLIPPRSADEQEYLRIGSPTGFTQNLPNQTVNAVIDAATLRETYTSPFAEAIRAGAGVSSFTGTSV